MTRPRRPFVIGMLIMFAVGAAARGADTGDIRRKYSTNSMEAAQSISQGIALVQGKKPKEALVFFESALKADPACGFAMYWKSLALADLGDLDQAIEAAKKAEPVFEAQGDAMMQVDNAINLGLLNVNTGDFEQSDYWMSRAIVADPDNKTGLLWKAYRNLAITLHEKEKKMSSAALAAILATDADPAKVPPAMAESFLKNVAAEEDTARVLYLDSKIPTVAPRATKSELTALDAPAALSDIKIRRLLTDPTLPYVIALGDQQKRYWKITPGEKTTVEAVEVSGQVIDGTLAGGHLFLSLGENIAEVNPATGTAIKTYNLGLRTAGSVAVSLSRRMVYFTFKSHVSTLNLDTSDLTDTGYPGQVVAMHPTEKYLYTRYKDEENYRSNVHTIIVNGRPVTFIDNSGPMDMQQTRLGKFYITPSGKLIFAEVRRSAASNGYDVTVSPDGNWVSVPGGGGWRPEGSKQNHPVGYVIAVFAAANLEHIQGSFSTEAYPMAIAFNPVTNQLAAIRAADATIYHLSAEGKPETTLKGESGKGDFSTSAVWTSDGAYLLLAHGGKGIAIYSNKLSPEEKAAGTSWAKSIIVEKNTSVALRKVSEPIAKLATFQPDEDSVTAKKSVEEAIAKGRTVLVTDWKDFPAYAQNKEANAAFQQAITDTAGEGKAGTRIYRLRKVLKDYPKHVPSMFMLGDALCASGQEEAGIPMLLDVVHTDMGQTDLSGNALSLLSGVMQAQKKPISSIECAAAAVQIDRGRPDWISRLSESLTNAGMTADAARVAALRPAGTEATVANSKLPVLRSAPEDAPKLTAEALFVRAAPSVVLIRSGDSSGTGVCVGRGGLILTSLHVVSGGDAIEIYPFQVKDGQPVKLEKYTGTVIVRNADKDLALIQMSRGPRTLVPLLVAAKSPKVGEKVYALGNPGMGNQTLDLTISDGIISATEREVHGNTYLQHTAGVNPGNSGGPVLNERGEVVGIVCLSANLKSVSFATPVEQVRAMFPTTAVTRSPATGAPTTAPATTAPAQN